MNLLTTLFFLAVAVSAQDENPRPASSPFEIARYVNQRHDISWKQRQDIHWDALLKGLHIPSQDLPTCGSLDRDPCAVEVIQVPGLPQVILRIEAAWWQETYWRFFFEGSKWRYGGAFVPFVKYFKPRHRIITFGGKPFLLLNGQGDAGTGLSSDHQAWFDLTLAKFEPIFGFTVGGIRSLLGFGVSQTVKAHVRSLEAGPPERIRVVRTVVFTFEGADEKPIPLGSRTAETVYTRGQNGNFEFDQAASTCDGKEVEEIYDDLANLSNEQFLRYDLVTLLQIAKGHDRRQKEALVRFLKLCENTAERKKLLAALSSR